MNSKPDGNNAAQPKVAGVAMVKDECDIIELFVRINSRLLDHLYIVDHSSKDGTREILLKLLEEGYPLTVYGHDAIDFQQAKVITSVVRQIASSGEYEYIVALDADEFINSSNRNFAESLRLQIPQGKCGLMKMETYVPLEDSYFGSEAPLFYLFRKRSPEEPQYVKIIISSEIAVNCTVGEGNHYAELNGEMVEALPVEATLQHVPVRSTEQIIRKALLGSHRLSIKKGRLQFGAQKEGYHWDDIATNIRLNFYKLPYSKLRDIALSYMDHPLNGIRQTVSIESEPIGLPSDNIVYSHLAIINPLKSLDEFTADLCQDNIRIKEELAAINGILAGLDSTPSLFRRLLTWWK